MRSTTASITSTKASSPDLGGCASACSRAVSKAFSGSKRTVTSRSRVTMKPTGVSLGSLVSEAVRSGAER